MRRLTLAVPLSLLATASLFAVSSCGGSALMENATPDMTMQVVVVPDMTVPKPPPDLSVPIVPPDLTVLHDLTPRFYPADAGPACGAMTCNQGDLCCVSGTVMNLQFACGKTCSDGGLFALSCSGPEQCGGNACCVTLGLGGGGGLAASDTGCQPLAMCTPVLDIQNKKVTTRFCHQDGDCGGQLPSCCTANTGNTSINICFDPQIAGLVPGMAITCP